MIQSNGIQLCSLIRCARFLTDQCPVSSILITLYMVFTPETRWEACIHTQPHTRQSSLIPCFIYYLDLNTHDPVSAGWYSVCTTTFYVSVYEFPVACNKDSMWPPAFRLVEPINLPLYSNTGHLWPSHIPNIFCAATPAQNTFSQ